MKKSMTLNEICSVKKFCKHNLMIIKLMGSFRQLFSVLMEWKSSIMRNKVKSKDERIVH